MSIDRLWNPQWREAAGGLREWLQPCAEEGTIPAALSRSDQSLELLRGLGTHVTHHVSSWGGTMWEMWAQWGSFRAWYT